MISYTLKQILNLVPEAYPLIKKANVEEEFPLGSRDSCIASALRIEYSVNIARVPVDSETMEKVASATQAYNVEQEVQDMAALMIERKNSAQMEKTASTETPAACMEKQASLEGELCGFKDIEGLVKKAEEILDQCKRLEVEPSDTVRRYSADAFLSKEAALDALNMRFHLTKNPAFVKLAAALGKEEALLPSGNLVRSLCRIVTGLDKEAGLNMKGFDFYRESLLVKSAAIAATRVRLGQEEYPLDAVTKIPQHHLASYLGEDIAKEMASDPMTVKAVVESLPSDLQRVLVSLMKNC